MSMVERVKTGIPGLDEILYGGIPKRNVVLLSGGPGTGKSIFSYQYLWNGLKMGEPGVFVALEEHPVQVRLNMSQFGWDVRMFEREGTFAIVDAFTGGIGEYSAEIRREISDMLEALGISLDESVNESAHGKRAIISTPESRCKLVVMPTDEELMIARYVVATLEQQKVSLPENSET